MTTHKATLSRREFLSTTSTGVVAAIAASPLAGAGGVSNKTAKLACSGGQPVRTKPWPSWPVWDRTAEDDILAVLRSGVWCRAQGTRVTEFERRYAELLGARSCLATASGTTALITALHTLGVEAGDEVIVSPYTFLASYNAIFMVKALPVFADTDPETFTINPARVEERITGRTRVILPVHILGLPVEMDPITAVARKHGVVVVEDACQAWLAEYKNRKCGLLGDLGCFSFQNSKHLPAGEGGAVVGNDETVVDRCHAFHNCGRPHGSFQHRGAISGFFPKNAWTDTARTTSCPSTISCAPRRCGLPRTCCWERPRIRTTSPTPSRRFTATGKSWRREGDSNPRYGF